MVASTFHDTRHANCLDLGERTFGLAHAAICFYAGVRSFRAIQSKDSNDDKQWLTFWLLYSIFELFTIVADLLLGWVLPFYNEIKAAFLVFIGVFNGASKLYPIIEPFLLKSEEVARKYEQRLSGKPVSLE